MVAHGSSACPRSGLGNLRLGFVYGGSCDAGADGQSVPCADRLVAAHKYTGFKQSLLMQLEDTQYQSLSVEERLFNLFEAEINIRQDKRITIAMTKATFKHKTAMLDQ